MGMRKSFLESKHCLNFAAPSSNSLVSSWSVLKANSNHIKTNVDKYKTKLLLVSLLFSLQSIKGKVMALSLFLNARLTNQKNNHNLKNLVYLCSKGQKASLDVFFPRSG